MTDEDSVRKDKTGRDAGQTEAIDEIEALLPWFATGALDPAEAGRVEAALAARPERLASLASIEEDRGETVGLNESFGAPSPDVWSRILTVAQSEPRRPPLARRLAGWFGFGAEPQRAGFVFAGVAAAVVILFEAAAIVSLLPHLGARAPDAYGTASAPAPAGVELLVSFAPEARMSDVEAFLKQNDATIVEGPRAGGFYKLRVGRNPARDPAARDPAALAKAFSAAGIVKLALPGAGK